ncbi:triose-phosphate isomerase [Rhodocyclaceae bacterium SMB388]
MKGSLVVGNWKMNGRASFARELLAAVRDGAPGGVRCAICVPYPYLPLAAGVLQGSTVSVGAQNVSAYQDGAYTGEVSVGMLADVGCRYVIVGHSERRSLCGETDGLVADKAEVVRAAGMTPIICIGETLAERDGGRVEAVLGRQLDAIAACLDATALSDVVIAYEPVWAIGTGRSASPEQVQAVLAWVRSWLAERVADAAGVAILYGGSVKADNAAELFALPDCDGGLIGGASLVEDEFLAICRAGAGRSSMI